MKNAVKQGRKINTTVKIFLLCFFVYFVCNTFNK